MSWLAQLFAKSPFEPVCQHQHKVQQCADVVPEMIDACLRGNEDDVHRLAKRASKLEAESDEIKNSVRDNLPRRLFMPVSRVDLLNVLAAQDDIADCAEDIGVLLSMRTMEPPPEAVAELLRQHVDSALQVVHRATEVVDRLEPLVSASFSGPEAKAVLELINLADREEHLSDKVQDQLAKTFFAHEDEFKPAAIIMWMKIFNKIGDLANFSEKMLHRIRLFLAN